MGTNYCVDKDLDSIFELRMGQAETGRKFWLDSSLDKYDYVLLLPHDDYNLNIHILQKLDSKLSTMPASPYIAILSRMEIKNEPNYEFIIVSNEMIECIISLFNLYKFTNKLIIGSFDLPYGRKLRNLLDAGLSTEGELIDIILSAI